MPKYTYQNIEDLMTREGVRKLVTKNNKLIEDKERLLKKIAKLEKENIELRSNILD